MNSQSDSADCDGEISEIQRALADRNLLQEKLIMLERITHELVQLHTNSGNETGGSVGQSSQGQTCTSNSYSAGTSGGRSYQCCRRVCVPSNQKDQTQSYSHSASSSSNCCQHSSDLSSRSTLAQCRLAIEMEDSSLPSSSIPRSSYYSSSQRSSSMRSRRCAPDCAQRLTEVTLRVLVKGYGQAEMSCLYEMEALLRNFIREKESSSRRNDFSTGSSGGCET